MPRWTRFRQPLGPDPQGDVDEELAFHLDMRTEELVARGETRARAAELARQRFGEFHDTRAACVDISRRRERKMARSNWIRELLQDMAYAMRAIRSTPAFAMVAVLTLALGIGATSAVFSVVHAVLIEGLPYPDAERLYVIQTVYPDGTAYKLSAPDFMSLQAEARRLDRVEAYTRGGFTLSGSGDPREIDGARVSRELCEMLGLGTVIGRPFAPEEFEPGRGRVALLDHGFWVRQLGGDATVVGRTLSIAGEPHLVIGVLAPDARLTERYDVYLPLEYGETFSADASRGRRSEFLRVIARAAPEATAEAVDAEVRRIGLQLQQRFPDTNERLTFGAAPLADLTIGESRRPLLVLFGAVGLVLLVACANVANLLLARGSARRSEHAVRAALGAGRGRLVRQLVAEAVVLGVAGGVLGMVFAYVAVRLLVWAEPADIPRLEAVKVNDAVLAFAAVSALLTALVFGVVPAVQSTGRGLLDALHGAGRGASGGGHRLRAALVVGETTLAVVLLVGAGLLVRSVLELMRVDAGFVPDHAVSFRVALQGPAYAEREALVARTQMLIGRLQALPGVTSVGAASTLPLSGNGTMLGFAVVGAPPPPANVNAEIAVERVSPDYLRAIGGAVLRGRGFTADDDRPDAPAVALVNEAAVRRWFPDGDPIGEQVDVDSTREVVGVFKDVRQEGLGEPAAPQLLAPFAQLPSRRVHFVVRGTGDPAALESQIRRAVAEVDPGLPIAAFASLDRLVATSIARPRFYTTVLVAFAAASLLLAAVGLFGVLSYTVVQRTREIGVRLALGAHTSHVTRMVVGSALRLVVVGLALGIAGALGLGRVLGSQLFGVTPTDPLTMASVAAVLVTTALVASYLPARRAASLDPGKVLRES